MNSIDMLRQQQAMSQYAQQLQAQSQQAALMGMQMAAPAQARSEQPDLLLLLEDEEA